MIGNYVWYKDGKIYKKTHDLEGTLDSNIYHPDGSSEEFEYYDGTDLIKFHSFVNANGISHRIGAPAEIKYDQQGNIIRQRYFEDGRMVSPPN